LQFDQIRENHTVGITWRFTWIAFPNYNWNMYVVWHKDEAGIHLCAFASFTKYLLGVHTKLLTGAQMCSELVKWVVLKSGLLKTRVDQKRCNKLRAGKGHGHSYGWEEPWHHANYRLHITLPE
jgi:hypothetical protein